jgi:hypothetical protein
MFRHWLVEGPWAIPRTSPSQIPRDGFTKFEQFSGNQLNKTTFQHLTTKDFENIKSGFIVEALESMLEVCESCTSFVAALGDNGGEYYRKSSREVKEGAN